jgi:hypothetical protein
MVSQMPRYRRTITNVLTCVIEAQTIEQAIEKSNNEDCKLKFIKSQSEFECIDEPQIKSLPPGKQE